MESERKDYYFVGLVDGMLVMKEVVMRSLRGSRSVAELEKTLRSESALLLSNVEQKRAESVLESLEA